MTDNLWTKGLTVTRSREYFNRQFFDVQRSDAPGTAIARFFTDNNPNAEADATLYASAPSLYEALELAVNTSDELAAQHGWERVPEAGHALNVMRAALSKARGEPA